MYNMIIADWNQTFIVEHNEGDDKSLICWMVRFERNLDGIYSVHDRLDLVPETWITPEMLIENKWRARDMFSTHFIEYVRIGMKPDFPPDGRLPIDSELLYDSGGEEQVNVPSGSQEQTPPAEEVIVHMMNGVVHLSPQQEAVQWVERFKNDFKSRLLEYVSPEYAILNNVDPGPSRFL